MIYIHIPFCVQKCRYCDFLSFPGVSGKIQKRYIDTLCRELVLRSGEAEGEEIPSVFFGGGTPSVLPEGCIRQLMDTVRENYRLTPNAEITLEMNPGTITPEKAKEWKAAGINRISMGMQSMDDGLLEKLGRIHRSGEVPESVGILVDAGFTNISFDLMFGLPGQNLETFRDTLDQVTKLPIRHLSVYSLIVEEGTEFDTLYQAGKLDLPPEEIERAMYHEAIRYLDALGMKQYEISNFAYPGYESRHNLGYWERKFYIGAGLGSSSLSLDQKRFKDTSDLSAYLDNPLLREEEECLSREDQMSETMFLGLRKISGISLKEFTDTFGISPLEVYGEEIRRHIDQGLLVLQEGRLFLSPRGLDLANQVFVSFV